MSGGHGRLADRTVLVTGGGRGIGRAIALRCAADGADVVVAARSVEELEETADRVRATGRRAQAVQMDLRDPASVEAGVAAARAAVGPVDLLVANSGVAGPTAPVWEVSAEDWSDTFAVNVTGVWLSCRAVLPGMIERGRGNIVVVGSMTGKRTLVNRSPYAASKTALIGFVRTAAADVGPHGIRVNLVSPGAVEGDRLTRVVEAQARSRGITRDAALGELTADSPLRRPVPPDDVGSAVAFLLSDEAASITGEDLNVSSGAVMY